MPPELTYCICGCRRSSNLFPHKGSLVFSIIHPAYVEMSAAALWSKASLSLAEPSISNESVWTSTHTCRECGTEIFPHIPRRSETVHLFFFGEISSVVCRNEMLSSHSHRGSNSMVKQSSSAAWREHGSRCWIFRSISFCYPLGTSVYLWLLSLGSGLVSSYRKTFFFCSRSNSVHHSLSCTLSFWVFLHVCVLDIFTAFLDFGPHSCCCLCFFQHGKCFVLRGHHTQ